MISDLLKPVPNGVPIRIISDKLLPTRLIQFRFPKSKRKRVRTKFSKNKANFRNSKTMIYADGQLLMTQEMVNKLNKR